ncbi:MAG: energy transducer TonB [Ignavibacteria bacterium]|jgi:protein TonB|nr:energy transducer TonB [Ignavibacteria bacterium]MCU7502570.1 energy transducer TonB [Ignavibacteria bacterium]MCU7515227.1 energy transducer TonB [Ignavibacteria bacterium]
MLKGYILSSTKVLHLIFAIILLSAAAQNSFAAKNKTKSLDFPVNIAEQGDQYLAFAEVMPEPVGGLATVYKKIVYPTIAKNAGLEGKVYVLVFIDEKGGVDDVKIVKGLGGGCDEAAIHAIKSTKFTPGKNKGVPVKVKLSLPIIFKLK